MSWLKLDDRFPNHEKIAALSDAAFRAHVEGLAYCAEQLTDGFISRRKAEKMANGCIGELTAKPAHGEPLWSLRGDTFEIHDYLVYNPPRAKVLADKKRQNERQSRFRNSVTDSVTNSKRLKAPSPSPDPLPLSSPVPKPEKTSALSLKGIDENVLGYFIGKVDREPSTSDLRSLKTLCRHFGPDIVTTAIGQAIVQKHAPDDWGYITSIAKGESA